MFYNSILKTSSGDLISALSIGSSTIYATETIHTERADNQALLLVFTGTMGAISRKVSIDGTNFYNVFDSAGINLTNLTGTSANSRMILIEQTGSGKVIAPYTQFRFLGADTCGATLTMNYMHTED